MDHSPSMGGPVSQPPLAAKASGHALLRPLIVVVALLGALTAVYLSPLRPWLEPGNFGHVRQVVASLGIWKYPLCVVVVGALMSCGVPRLLLCGAAGAALGFWGGIVVGEIGGLLGSYALFLFTRWGGQAWALRHWPKMRKLADLIQEQGTMGVILLRQLPIHGTLTNLCLGLSHLKHRHFLLGTAIGLLPEAVAATLLGAGVTKGSWKGTIGYFGMAAAAFAVIWIIGGYGLRAMKNNRSASVLLAESESLKELDKP